MMSKCKDCKYWDSTGKPDKRGIISGECRKANAYSIDNNSDFAADALDALDDSGMQLSFTTGPLYGCVHWVASSGMSYDEFLQEFFEDQNEGFEMFMNDMHSVELFETGSITLNLTSSDGTTKKVVVSLAFVTEGRKV